jgi:membrane-associated phospholipid phosphatase
MFRIKVLLLVMLLCFAISVPVWAGDGIETAGEVLTFLLPATAAGLTVGFMDTEGMLQFGESAALTLGLSYGLKYTINEKRPNGGDHSFPSNHTAISFASAEFMRKRYGWEYGIPAYVAATFVAYSRVESKQHYTHDVIAAAAIGIGSSYLFTQPYKGWQIGLDIDHEYYGILMSYTF